MVAFQKRESIGIPHRSKTRTGGSVHKNDLNNIISNIFDYQYIIHLNICSFYEYCLYIYSILFRHIIFILYLKISSLISLPLLKHSYSKGDGSHGINLKSV